MIKKLILTAILSLIVCIGLATEPKDDPNYSIPSSYKITKVVKVTITAASIRNDYDPEEDCSTFVVTPKLVTFFFNHSQTVSQAYRMHQSDFTSCESQGLVEFENGDEAKWSIQRGGIAFLSVLHGKFKDKVIILRCRKCEDWGL